MDPQVIELPLPGGAATALLAWPHQAAAAPVVLWLPAMGVRADFYRPWAEHLHREGLNVAVGELRGQGRSSLRASRGTDFGYLEFLREDLPALLEAVRSRYADSPVWLGGHSLGGHMAALGLGLHPGAARGLVLVAAGSPYHRNWPFPRNLMVAMMAAVFRALTVVHGHLPGRPFTGGSPQARRLIGEWSGFACTGKLRVHGLDESAETVLGRVTAPVLSISFSDDPFAPRAAASHLLGKLNARDPAHLHLTPAEAGAAEMGHFRWVKQPAGLAGRVVDFLRHADGGDGKSGTA